jgi:hypothetical protein
MLGQSQVNECKLQTKLITQRNSFLSKAAEKDRDLADLQYQLGQSTQANQDLKAQMRNVQASFDGMYNKIKHLNGKLTSLQRNVTDMTVTHEKQLVALGRTHQKDCDKLLDMSNRQIVQVTETLTEQLEDKDLVHSGEIGVLNSRMDNMSESLKLKRDKIKELTQELEQVNAQQDLQAQENVQEENVKAEQDTPPPTVTHAKQLSTKKPVGKFACAECNSKFHTKNGLIGHRNIHQGKTFDCQQCTKTFTSPRAYQQHQQYHLEGGVNCTVCAKHFQREATLKIHMQSHTGPKFLCNVEGCTKRYTYKADYDQHVTYGHLPTKTVPCPLCDNMFQTPGNAKSHLRSNHPEGSK